MGPRGILEGAPAAGGAARVSSDSLALALPPDLVEAIAQRAAAIVLERSSERPSDASPYMTLVEACEYLRCKRQRIDNLLLERRLTKVKEGGRLLLLRAEVEQL